MTPGMRFLLLAFQYAAGVADSVTGLLLVFAPVWTLHLMGLHIMPVPESFASFIGVFVFCVGFTYVWAAVAWSRAPGLRDRWITQWILTAIFRTCVAIFVALELAAGRLEPGWITVALTDAALAAIQWTGLLRGWLHVAR
jgi:hypothetical protein